MKFLTLSLYAYEDCYIYLQYMNIHFYTIQLTEIYLPFLFFKDQIRVYEVMSARMFLLFIHSLIHNILVLENNK